MKKKVVLYLSFLILIFGFIYFLFGLTTLYQNKSIESQNNTNKLPDKDINPTASIESTASESAKVLRVIDGDTIEVNLNGQKIKVRYIGVDTPETVDPRRAVGCFGKEASDENERVLGFANKKLVEDVMVYLEKDISETDKFGRLLRYVYVNKDGQNIFVNDYLIRQGFAKAVTYPPDVKYSQQFVNSQREAVENNRGLWQKCQ